MIYKYTWRILYYNGNIINQFDGDREIMWRDVNKSHIKNIYWIDSNGIVAGKVNVGGGDVEMCRRNHISMKSHIPVMVEYLIGRDGEYTVRLE